MDKNTLSNYGWIVVCILVISVLMALATPFGKFISTAIKNSVEAMFVTTETTLDDNTGNSSTIRRLSTPSLSVYNDVLHISRVSGATSYEISIDGKTVLTTSERNIDLSDKLTSNKTYLISVIAIGSGAKPSNEAKINYTTDGNGNGTGESLTCTHTYKTYTSVDDKEHNVQCDTCKEDLGNLAHNDADSNSVCDDCGGTVQTPCLHENTYYLSISNAKHSINCSKCHGYLGDETHIFNDGTCVKCDGKCKHYDKTYTSLNDEQHNMDCKTCGLDVGNEKHSYQNGICLDCGNVCSHNTTSYKPLDSDYHYEMCNVCKKEIKNEKHTFENGACSKCSFVCVHNEKTYEFVDNTKHNVFCADCNGGLGVEEHSYVNGICSKCNGECTHTDVSYTALDNANHSVSCSHCLQDLGNEKHEYADGTCLKCSQVCTHTNISYTPNDDTNHEIICDDCKKDLGSENHEYKDGVCEKCENECKHEEVKYTSIDDTNHNKECFDCGTNLGDENHNYENSECNNCEHSCAHTNKEYVSVDELEHSMKCSDCTAELGNDQHGYVNGVCEECKQECSHNDLYYQSIDNNVHNVICLNCGNDFGNKTHNYIDDICQECGREYSAAIPEGDTYYVGVTSTTVNDYTGATEILVGDGTSVFFPETSITGDVYVCGEYEYRYNMYHNGDVWSIDETQNGWGVKYIGSSTEPVDMLSHINKAPIICVDYAFANTTITKAPAIPDTVKYMDYLFYNCAELVDVSDVVIPESVKTLNSTFYNCSSLTDLSEFAIPEGVTSLRSTFYNCTSLTKLPVFPSTLRTISYPFNNCSSLERIELHTTSITTFSNVFRNCSSLKEITLPATLTNANKSYFTGATALETVYFYATEDEWYAIGGVDPTYNNADVVFIDDGLRSKLDTPEIEINNSILTIKTPSENATKYVVYVNGVRKTTMTASGSINLTSSYITSDGTYEISVRAMGDAKEYMLSDAVSMQYTYKSPYLVANSIGTGISGKDKALFAPDSGYYVGLWWDKDMEMDFWIDTTKKGTSLTLEEFNTGVKNGTIIRVKGYGHYMVTGFSTYGEITNFTTYDGKTVTGTIPTSFGTASITIGGVTKSGHIVVVNGYDYDPLVD